MGRRAGDPAVPHEPRSWTVAASGVRRLVGQPVSGRLRRCGTLRYVGAVQHRPADGALPSQLTRLPPHTVPRLQPRPTVRTCNSRWPLACRASRGRRWAAASQRVFRRLPYPSSSTEAACYCCPHILPCSVGGSSIRNRASRRRASRSRASRSMIVPVSGAGRRRRRRMSRWRLQNTRCSGALPGSCRR